MAEKRREEIINGQAEQDLNRTSTWKKQPLSEDLKFSEERRVYTKLSGSVRTGSVWYVLLILITENDSTPF